MNKKQRKVLETIFERPIKSNIRWNDIEALLISLGAEISEGNGSRVRIYLNSIRAVFHRPHPTNETDKGALLSMRKFLKNAGVKNDEI
jgi:HicA toxin of bacterial toxin-antitoxin,